MEIQFKRYNGVKMAKESYYSSCDWDIKWKIEKIPLFNFKNNEVKDFFNGLGIGLTNNGNYWWNDNIEVYCVYMNKNAAYLDDLSITIRNKNTNAGLGYEGYKSFGHYIQEIFVEKYCVKQPGGGRWHSNSVSIRYDYASDKTEEFKKIYFEELSKAIKATNDRMNLKHKKETIKDKVQTIENELDYAIIDMGEEVKKHGLSFEQRKPDIAAATLLYHFTVPLKGSWGRLMWGDPFVYIRKLKTGKYTMSWRNMNSHDGDTSTWHKIDDTVTPDDMKKFLRDYFQDWYDMKLDRTFVGKPSWAKA